MSSVLALTQRIVGFLGFPWVSWLRLDFNVGPDCGTLRLGMNISNSQLRKSWFLKRCCQLEFEIQNSF